jgi:hypothetical protein
VRRPGRATVARLGLGAAAAALSTAATLRVRESALTPWAAYRVALAGAIVVADHGRSS